MVRRSKPLGGGGTALAFMPRHDAERHPDDAAGHIAPQQQPGAGVGHMTRLVTFGASRRVAVGLLRRSRNRGHLPRTRRADSGIAVCSGLFWSCSGCPSPSTFLGTPGGGG